MYSSISFKLFNTKGNNTNFIQKSCYRKINLKVKYIWAKDFLNEINCMKPLLSNTSNGRRHSKLFTNCHVAWNTQYIKSIGVYFIFVFIVSESKFIGFRSDMSSTVLEKHQIKNQLYGFIQYIFLFKQGMNFIWTLLQKMTYIKTKWIESYLQC